FARAERMSASVLCAAFTAGWMYLSNGMSLLIVRQIPAHEAFAVAAQLRATWIPAVLAGLGGALLGRNRVSRRSPAPFLLACLVSVAGLLGVLDAILPSHGHSLIAALAPQRVRPLTHVVGGPLGFALVYAALGLARGRRRA